ncbi:hypothetical protein AB4254_13610 [Vibrio breoganii]
MFRTILEAKDITIDQLNILTQCGFDILDLESTHTTIEHQTDWLPIDHSNKALSLIVHIDFNLQSIRYTLGVTTQFEGSSFEETFVSNLLPTLCLRQIKNNLYKKSEVYQLLTRDQKPFKTIEKALTAIEN